MSNYCVRLCNTYIPYGLNPFKYLNRPMLQIWTIGGTPCKNNLTHVSAISQRWDPLKTFLFSHVASTYHRGDPLEKVFSYHVIATYQRAKPLVNICVRSFGSYSPYEGTHCKNLFQPIWRIRPIGLTPYFFVPTHAASTDHMGNP